MLAEAAMLVAAQHRLPVRTVDPGPHGLLRHRIQNLGSPNVRFLPALGLLHDLDSLSLYQAVDAHLVAGAGRDLLVYTLS